MRRIKAFLFNKGTSLAYAVITVIFMFVPDDLFMKGFIGCNWSDATVLLVNRLIVSVAVFVMASVLNQCYRRFRKSVTLDDKTYVIKVEYADLFAKEDGKKVVNFDECFSTNVGDRPEDIRPSSVCGQYLAKYPIDDMQGLIESAGLKAKGVSQFNKMPRYEPGTIIPRGNYLLMAFAKLDSDGLGVFSYDRYLECLNRLWSELDRYHGTDDVYLPILGSRIVRFDKDLTQQELLDVMISSYRLSPKKLKKPCVLHIVCREREDFSLNDIFGVD